MKKENSFLETLFNDLSESDLKQGELLSYISAKILDKRIELDMSQKEFSEYMNISQAMVSKWESCNYNFTICSLTRICEKLNFDLDIKLNDKKNKFKYCYVDYNTSNDCKQNISNLSEALIAA